MARGLAPDALFAGGLVPWWSSRAPKNAERTVKSGHLLDGWVVSVGADICPHGRVCQKSQVLFIFNRAGSSKRNRRVLDPLPRLSPEEG